MNDPPPSDPTAWRLAKAPSLDEIEVLAAAAFRRLPQRFRQLCGNLVIRVEDFPADDVIEEMGLEKSAPVKMPNLIWLYRRPILDYWAEHDETLGKIVTHVLLHEIGHHFGFSDEDIAAIEADVA